ncbi:MAG: hypothetical protein ABIW38_01730 [Ferruginibacter sp.]
MKKKNIPFDFVLDYLFPLEVTVKPMFGLWAVYMNDKIIFALRQRDDHPETNGVWIATKSEHHESLKKEFPSMCSISIFSKGIKETSWQVLPADSEDFETSVIQACNLVKHYDTRIGVIPKPRQSKTRKK